jgi:arabinan endo-1,5-alpha-L-arabinosidase
MTNATLDPANPRYKWVDGGLVVNSTEGEALNAIDPGVCQAPDGTLWLSYGSYHGNIQLVQLNPDTGQRISPKSPVSIISSQSEASDIIYHDGYFYLLVNHGSCCQGKDSTYNIRKGRSAIITGPYLDRYGRDMADGAGGLFLAASGSQIGPAQFGRLFDDGVEKFSCHYEVDLSKGGRSILDIRPLLWTSDGWPAPGKNLKDGTYQIQSKRTGTVLQMFRATAATRSAPTSTATTMPADETRVINGRYLAQDHQEWKFAAAGGGFYKITNAASGKTLELRDTGEAAIVAFTGTDNQLWKVDQLSDGSYRLQLKANHWALTATPGNESSSPVSIQKFSGDDTQRWYVKTP